MATHQCVATEIGPTKENVVRPHAHAIGVAKWALSQGMSVSGTRTDRPYRKIGRPKASYTSEGLCFDTGEIDEDALRTQDACIIIAMDYPNLKIAK